MDIQRLKQETEADHRAVEGALPLMGEALDRARYVECLRRMYGVVAAWEDRAADLAPEWMQAMLARRRRKGMLRLDLAWFGVVVGDERPGLPEMNDLPSLLGAMYVMEGSTLGARGLPATSRHNSI